MAGNKKFNKLLLIKEGSELERIDRFAELEKIIFLNSNKTAKDFIRKKSEH